MIDHKLAGAAVLCACLMTAVPAAATPLLVFDGHALRQACANGDAYYTYGKCAGYIIGVHDQYVLAKGLDADICLVLEDGSGDGLIEPVVDFLASDGIRLYEPASSLVLRALRQAYPCDPA